MKVIRLVLEGVAALIPDFQTWGLNTSVFLSLYYCATSLGFTQARGIDSGLLLSVVAGYVVTLGRNLANFLPDAEVLYAVTLPGPTSRVAVPAPRALAQQSATITFSEDRP